MGTVVGVEYVGVVGVRVVQGGVGGVYGWGGCVLSQCAPSEMCPQTDSK